MELAAGDGLELAAIGMVPKRRLLLEAVYGFLTLKNGVPIGYVLNSALFGSSYSDIYDNSVRRMDNIIGKSRAMQQVYEQVAQAAPSNTTVSDRSSLGCER